MYLGNFIHGLNKKYKKTFFSGIAFNSLKVKKDNIFFAIKGSKFDGHNYIQHAIKKGAKIIVLEKRIKFQNKNVIYIKSKKHTSKQKAAKEEALF